MALVGCSECGRGISDKATACPGCGAPTGSADEPTGSKSASRVRRAGAVWEGAGFCLIVGGMITAMAADGTAGSVGGVALVSGLVVFLVGRFQ